MHDLAISKDHYTHVPHYSGEVMEEVMQDYRLYPPMRVWGDSLKYIVATLVGKILPCCRVKESQADEIYDMMSSYISENVTDLVEYHRHMDGLNVLWPALKQKMLGNRGLWKMMRDSGAESLSFAQFPVSLVPRAIALESAFGVNYDNAGIYRKLLRVQDLSMRSAAVEPELVELRRRAHHARECIFRHIPVLKEIDSVPSEEKLGTVVTTGAGLLIELRKYGMTLAQIQSLRVIACDMDESLRKELDMVCRYDFGVSFAETGIEYRFCAVEELLKDDTLYGKVNVVLMDGILSYCKNERQIQNYIYGAERLCDPANSVIFCDLTVFDWSLLRCAVVQGWVSEDKNFAMHPELSAKIAVRKMRRICRNLDFKFSYEIDPRNPSPLGVVFWINDTIA